MPRDDDPSLGGDQTFAGKIERDDSPRSLSDQSTYAGGPRIRDPQSLGDEATFGDAGGDDTRFDDGIEVVDLSTRYTIEGTLGKGGMGEVLLATDTRLKRKVAIKRILGDAAKSRTAVSRFLTEAQSIAALNHPNIVQIYDYGQAADGPFLIMEYAPLGHLDRLRVSQMTLTQVLEQFSALANALACVHASDLLHNDIKPSNILLFDNNILKLSDFGLASLSVSGHASVRAITHAFAAPEVKASYTTSTSSDVWSFARTLVYLLSDSNSLPPTLSQSPLVRQLHSLVITLPAHSRIPASDVAALLEHFSRHAHVGDTTLSALLCTECRSPVSAATGVCVNPNCNATLQMQCPVCDGTTTLQDTQCTHCNAYIPRILTHARSQLLHLKSEFHSAIAAHDSNKASNTANIAKRYNDPRLWLHATWVHTSSSLIDAMISRDTAYVTSLRRTLLDLAAKGDFASALTLLKEQPPWTASYQCDDQGNTLLAVKNDLTRRQHTHSSLTSELEQLEACDYDTAIVLLTQLLQLQPHNPVVANDLAKATAMRNTQREMLAPLRERIQLLLAAHDYRQVLAASDACSASSHDSFIASARQEALKKLVAYKATRTSISECLENDDLLAVVAIIDGASDKCGFPITAALKKEFSEVYNRVTSEALKRQQCEEDTEEMLMNLCFADVVSAISACPNYTASPVLEDRLTSSQLLLELRCRAIMNRDSESRSRYRSLLLAHGLSDSGFDASCETDTSAPANPHYLRLAGVIGAMIAASMLAWAVFAWYPTATDELASHATMRSRHRNSDATYSIESPLQCSSDAINSRDAARLQECTNKAANEYGAVSASEWHEFITALRQAIDDHWHVRECVSIAESVFCTSDVRGTLSTQHILVLMDLCVKSGVYCPDLIDECVEHVAKSELAVTTLSAGWQEEEPSVVVALIINTQLGRQRVIPFQPLTARFVRMSKTELSFVVQWATTHPQYCDAFIAAVEQARALQDEKWLPFAELVLETAESVKFEPRLMALLAPRYGSSDKWIAFNYSGDGSTQRKRGVAARYIPALSDVCLAGGHESGDALTPATAKQYIEQYLATVPIMADKGQCGLLRYCQVSDWLATVGQANNNAFCLPSGRQMDAIVVYDKVGDLIVVPVSGKDRWEWGDVQGREGACGVVAVISSSLTAR